MRTRPLDTTPAARSQYEAVLDRTDGPPRLHAALQRSDAVREIRLAEIRSRHPELGLQEAVARLVAEDHGVTLPRQT